MTRFIAMVVFFAALGSGRPVARAWDPLRRPAPDVQEGNAALRAGDAERALAAYDRAARRLPDAPGVQLNRGLALLARGDLPGARDALLAATDPGAAPHIRADAYADLGLAFFREADAMAEAEDHQQSQQLFREAVDAFRRSLRVRPGDRNTAWNLELAARRLREEREKQEQQEQEQQEQEQQEQDEQEQDEQEQDEQEQDEQEQDEQEQEQDPQEQDPGDESDPQEQAPEDPGDAQEPSPPESEDPNAEPQTPPEDPEPNEAPDGREADSEPPAPEPPPEGAGQALPEDARRLLDSLQDDEDSLQRLRARQRAARERRRPAQDW